MSAPVEEADAVGLATSYMSWLLNFYLDPSTPIQSSLTGSAAAFVPAIRP
jgi:hypothetical protein